MGVLAWGWGGVGWGGGAGMGVGWGGVGVLAGHTAIINIWCLFSNSVMPVYECIYIASLMESSVKWHLARS